MCAAVDDPIGRPLERGLSILYIRRIDTHHRPTGCDSQVISHSFLTGWLYPHIRLNASLPHS
jgi:hypothetical protein